jgi:hypothetical protein
LTIYRSSGRIVDGEQPVRTSEPRLLIIRNRNFWEERKRNSRWESNPRPLLYMQVLLPLSYWDLLSIFPIIPYTHYRVHSVGSLLSDFSPLLPLILYVYSFSHSVYLLDHSPYCYIQISISDQGHACTTSPTTSLLLQSLNG